MFRFPRPSSAHGARFLVLALAVCGALLASPAGSAPPARSDIVVFLKGGTLPASAAQSSRFAEVRAAQGAVLASLGEDGIRLTYQYDALPAFAGGATPETIARLEADPRVAAVWPNFQGQAADDQSFALVHVNEAQDLGYSGQGVVVAVIDSGINGQHPAFTGSILHEECFMASFGLSSHCPDGSGRQSGPGAAQDDLGHGTNVAGIIGGDGTQAPGGVAPAAWLEAFKVIDTHNTFFFSDLTAAIDHILAEHPEIDILNMSLGSFNKHTPDVCTDDVAFDAIRAAGILAFASSMNQRYKDGMGYPACADSVVSVGAVYDSDMANYTGFGCVDAPADADQVACWSNSDSTLDLLGPGCIITAAGLNGPTSSYCGTSQASPHAAGAAALLLEQRPDASPEVIEGILKAKGVPITDDANGVTTPRLDVLASLSISLVGDVNCNFRIDSGDVLTVINYASELETAAGGGCPPVGGGASTPVAGDVTCDGAVTTLDALVILLHVAALPPLPALAGCPDVGDEI